MNKNERAIIDLSIEILTDARDRSGKEKVDTVPVRLALRCLRPYMPLHWPLSNFWDAAGGEHEIGRSANCTASLNGIKVQLQAGGVRVQR
jgi:hypothetical protein